MGTDIHFFIEKRPTDGWILPVGLVENELWNQKRPNYGPMFRPKSLQLGRNYALFAVLANVRNPIRSVQPFRCISEPRGLPGDVSQEILVWHKLFNEEAHSASWLFLRELNEFEWDQTIVRWGLVDTSVAHLFSPERIGFPGHEEWPEDIPVGDRGGGVEVKWIEMYRQAVGPDFLNETLAHLKSFGGEDVIRAVFWFDS